MHLAHVDDDNDVRRALSRLLAAMGHKVTAFVSAEDFEAAPVAVDCMLIDVRLPGLNGFELRERLRGRLGSIPMVLMTGDGDRLDPDTRIGDTPIMSKPFDDVALTKAIADAIVAAKSGRPGHGG